jgi:hypothetical protein
MASQLLADAFRLILEEHVHQDDHALNLEIALLDKAAELERFQRMGGDCPPRQGRGIGTVSANGRRDGSE